MVCIIIVVSCPFERLCKLKLPSLEFRRVRGDLIEVYKLTHDFYDAKTIKDLLTLTSTDLPTRNNNFKLFKPRVATKKYQNFFTNRVINWWNRLPSEIVNAVSINSFKNCIDDFFNEYMYCTNF